MKKLVTLIVVLIAGAVAVPAAAASSQPPEPSALPRVVGGAFDATPDTAWIASLNYQGLPSCGGSLVAPSLVLTAAHCTRRTRARQWVVRLESKDRALGGHVRRVRRIHEFPGYIPALDYGDMALLRLRQPVEVEPVGLVPHGTHWIGERGYIAGWGQTAATRRSSPRRLRSAWIPIRADSVCKRKYGFGYSGGTMICAGSNEASACMGDSGGPLARVVDGRWQLLGVTSYGRPGCNRPGAYAWVGSKPLRRWLRTSLGG